MNKLICTTIASLLFVQCACADDDMTTAAWILGTPRDVSYNSEFWDRVCVVVGEVVSVVPFKHGEPNLVLKPHSTVTGSFNCAEHPSLAIHLSRGPYQKARVLKKGDKVLVVFQELDRFNSDTGTPVLEVPDGTTNNVTDGGDLIQTINSYDDSHIVAISDRVRSLSIVSAGRVSSKSTASRPRFYGNIGGMSFSIYR